MCEDAMNCVVIVLSVKGGCANRSIDSRNVDENENENGAALVKSSVVPAGISVSILL